MTKRNLALCFGVVLSMTTMLRADIVGSNPQTALPTLDTCSGCLFAYIQFGASNAGQAVLSYQFYNGAGAGTTNELTPILFEKTGFVTDRTFEIRGIGNTSTGFAAGYNTVPFVLAQGSATVLDANTFFGYVDGDASGKGNTGTIVSNYPTGPGATTYYHIAITGGVSAGDSIGDFHAFTDSPTPGQNARTYSLQVTTTPEPGFYGALALGLCGLVVGLKRRSRRA